MAAGPVPAMMCQVGFVIIDDFLPENMARAMKVLCFNRDWGGWGSPLGG